MAASRRTGFAIFGCEAIRIYALNGFCSIGPAHMASRRNRPINMPAPYLKRVWLDPSRVTDREAYPFCLPLLRDDFELGSTRRSPSSSAKTAPENPPCSKGSPCSPAMTRPAAARGTCRSIIPMRWRRWAATLHGAYAQAGCPRSPTAGSSAPRASSRWRDIWIRSSENRWRAASGLSLAFPRRRLSAFLRGTLPAAGHLRLRRAGVGVVALAPDRIPEADAADGKSAIARSSWPRIRRC